MVQLCTSDSPSTLSSNSDAARSSCDPKSYSSHLPPSYTVLDSVKLISRHLTCSNLPFFQNSKERTAKIHEWLKEYHTNTTLSEDDRIFYRQCIIMNLWYLFPYVLTSYKFKKGDIFEDALQNLVITISKAIDKFDLSRETKFTSYITGYIKEAVSTTLRSESLIRVPTTTNYKKMVYLRLNHLREDVKADLENSMTEDDSLESNEYFVDPESSVIYTDSLTSTVEDEDAISVDDIKHNTIKTKAELSVPSRAHKKRGRKPVSQSTKYYYAQRRTPNSSNNESDDTSSYDIDDDYTTNINLSNNIVLQNIPDALTPKCVDDDYICKEKLRMLREALNNPTVLTEKEKLIINLRYGLHDSTPKTLLQIADILKSNGHKATKVWVFTIEKKANRKLYNYFKKRKVLDLFE